VNQIVHLPHVKLVNPKFPVDLDFHYANQFRLLLHAFYRENFNILLADRRAVNVLVKCVTENFKETLAD